MLIERVDGYASHPGARPLVEEQPQLDPAEIPWAPLRKPLTESVVSMISSAAIHLKTDSPFDYDREWEVPTCGGPVLPRDTEPRRTGRRRVQPRPHRYELYG